MNKYVRSLLWSVGTIFLIILGYNPESNLAAFRWLYMVYLCFNFIGWIALVLIWAFLDRMKIADFTNAKMEDMPNSIFGIVKAIIVVSLFYTYKQEFLMNLNIFLFCITFPIYFSLKRKIKKKLQGQSL